MNKKDESGACYRGARKVSPNRDFSIWLCSWMVLTSAGLLGRERGRFETGGRKHDSEQFFLSDGRATEWASL